ncbi:hypothetical protein BaRGS_00015800 [Batillaria attramentaria]|uniref:Uncharacterized protein n=1 Tax=Batillaria attramentaria TaxID=370345 RepID=A0ABD0L0P4_9CAEN
MPGGQEKKKKMATSPRGSLFLPIKPKADGCGIADSSRPTMAGGQETKNRKDIVLMVPCAHNKKKGARDWSSSNSLAPEGIPPLNGGRLLEGGRGMGGGSGGNGTKSAVAESGDFLDSPADRREAGFNLIGRPLGVKDCCWHFNSASSGAW